MMAGRVSRRVAILPALSIVSLLGACASTGIGTSGGPVPKADPDTLIGLVPQQIGETLGAPELQRSEPPAEVWQYRSPTCVFDLYLFEEDEAGPRAVHYEARSRSNTAVDPAECLGSVIAHARMASTDANSDLDPTRL